MAINRVLMYRYWWAPIVLIVLWMLMVQHDRVVRYKALSEQRIAEVKEAVAIVRRADSTMQARDSMVAEERRELRRAREQARFEEARARLRTHEAIDSLVKGLTAEQNLQLTHVVAGYEEQLRAKDEQMTSLRAELSLADSMLVEKDSVLAAHRRMTDSLVRVWIRAEKAGAPTLLGRVVNSLPVVVAATVLILK